MKITSIVTYPVSMLLKSDLAMVSALGAQAVCEFVITVVRTDTGVTGVGEASGTPAWSGETQQGMLASIHQVLASVLIGRDPLQASLLSDLMDKILIGNPFAKASLEMALLDVAGKYLGVPVYALLGGGSGLKEIPLKFSIGAYEPARAARLAEQFADQGFRGVKVKVGVDLSSDLERVAAVRSAVGGTLSITVDANGGWNEREATYALPHLERLNVNALEQPLPRWNLRGCARLRRRAAIPLVLDEAVFTRHEALEAIRCGAGDVISIYPGKNGGLWRSVEIARLAAAAGLECVIGSNLETEIGSCAMLHLAAAVPNLASFIDHEIIGPLYHRSRLAVQPLKLEEGLVTVPQAAGLGVELDYARLEETQRQETR